MRVLAPTPPAAYLAPMTPAPPSPERLRRCALIGFVGHLPGVKLLVSRTVTPRLARANVAAVALTLAAMLWAFTAAPAGAAPRWVFVAWLAGHFAWSTTLAAWILRGGGVLLR